MSDINSLIEIFRDAAIKKGDGADPNEKDSDLFMQLSDVYDEIERSGEEGLKLFSHLLLDSSPHVKLWVASQLLYNGMHEGGLTLITLNELSSSPEVYGLSASMVLEQYNKGELKSPL